MDPVAQTLAQQQSGSAEGQGFADYFIKGRQLAQQQQQINLSARRVALEEAQGKREQQSFDLLRPYAAKNAENQAVILGQQVQINTDKLALTTQVNNAMPEILQLHSQFMEAPDGFSNPALRDRAEALTQRYPRAFAQGTPGSDLLTEIYGGQMFKQRFQQLRDMDAQMKGTGMRIQQFNPKTGNMEFMRDTTGAAPGTMSTIGKEIADYNALVATGDTESAALVKAKMLAEGEKNGWAVEFGEDGKVTRIAQGGKTGAAVPAAIATSAMKAISGLRNVDLQIQDIRSTLRPQDVGVKGYVSDKLLDTLLPAFGVETGDAKRMENREKIKALQENSLRLVSDDSRFSNADREAVRAIQPGVGPTDPYQRNIVIMDTLQKINAKRALIQAQAAKMETPEWAVKALPNIEIVDAVAKGLLTKDQARAEIQRRLNP